jgi:phage N-6-adenine-methyltransferase
VAVTGLEIRLEDVYTTGLTAEQEAEWALFRQGQVSVHFSSKTDLWATPQSLFDTLQAEFGFTLDVCANAENAKCLRYFTEEQDGLAQDWTGVCWMNPPYGREIGKWVKKAYQSAEQGATIVCLLPARTDTAWWQTYVSRATEIRLYKGRLKFGSATNSAPFPSALVVFRSGELDTGRVIHTDPKAAFPN